MDKLSFSDAHTRKKMNELEKAAVSGDVKAIAKYADFLFQQNEYANAQLWYLKGCHAGSCYCMLKYGYMTLMSQRASVQIDPSECIKGLRDLDEAEKWAKIAKNAGELQSDDLLYGRNGIYSGMTWCNYLAGLKTKDISYFRNVIDCYEKIAENPTSQDKYAYMDSLERTGNERKQVEIAEELYKDYDDTLESYMLEVVCGNLSQAYLEGKTVEPDYQKAYQYAAELYRINPEDNRELYNLFSSGEMKKKFNYLHGGSSNQSETKNGGCYIATAVYGSYDCPEVWTLRRFRDNNLSTNKLGRLFIKFYYKVSPVLVEIFGDQKWFNVVWKSILDKLVNRLNNQGVKNTIYHD